MEKLGHSEKFEENPVARTWPELGFELGWWFDPRIFVLIQPPEIF